MGRPPKAPIYELPHGIQVVGEYAPSARNPYWRVRIRPHLFFPNVKVAFGGAYVRRNRVILASKPGRALTPEEHAHHDDEDRGNDHVENLESLSPAEHNRHHKTGAKHSDESRAKTSATIKAMYASGEMVAHPIQGSKQASAKLTEEQVGCIKRSTEKTGVLVKRYGVSRTVIKQIRNGTIWRHVK